MGVENIYASTSPVHAITIYLFWLHLGHGRGLGFKLEEAVLDIADYFLVMTLRFLEIIQEGLLIYIAGWPV